MKAALIFTVLIFDSWAWAALISKERNFDSALFEDDEFRLDYDELESEENSQESIAESATTAPTIQLHSSNQRLGGLKAKRGQFPWQALLVLDNSFMCGGSLIAPQWILTAAHCTLEVTNFTVVLGTINRDNQTSATAGMRVLKTRSKFVHDKFDDLSLNNDIALLKLPVSVDTSGPWVSTIRLPRRSDEFKSFKGKTGFVSGFGKGGDSKPPSQSLNYVRRRIVDNKICLRTYNKMIVTPSVLCIYNGDRRGTCNGDSGGPFVYKESDRQFTQIGLVSFGSIHSCATYPGGYTRVPSYVDWIAKVTGISVRY